MQDPVLLCTDGSDLAQHALAAGLALLGTGRSYVVVTVMEEPDPTLVTGTGFTGGVMSPQEFDQTVHDAVESAEAVVERVRDELHLADADTHVLDGAAADAICAYAARVGAAAIVLGSRGRGGLRRAVLGSVSDHVVRNAPCPVLVVGPHGFDEA